MKDRISTKPGRVYLLPIADNVYTLYRADEPAEGDEGTPINKATLLTDETAALYGLTDEAVPDDVLAILADAVRVANGSVQRANGDSLILPAPTTNMAVGSYVGTGTYGSAANATKLTLPFQPRVLLITGSKRAPYDYTPVYWILQYPDSEMRMYANLKSGVTWSGNSVSWWSESISYSDVGIQYPGDAQMNELGVTYNYVALGVV